MESVQEHSDINVDSNPAQQTTAGLRERSGISPMRHHLLQLRDCRRDRSTYKAVRVGAPSNSEGSNNSSTPGNQNDADEGNIETPQLINILRTDEQKGLGKRGYCITSPDFCCFLTAIIIGTATAPVSLFVVLIMCSCPVREDWRDSSFFGGLMTGTACGFLVLIAALLTLKGMDILGFV